VHELRRSSTGSGSGTGYAEYETTVFRVDPAELGFAPATLDDLRGGDASVNAEAIRRVVAGDASPHRDVAVLNAAASLVVVGKAADFPAGVALAGSVIDDGRAASVLEALIRVSQEASAAEG
jgi:anthranilate phosphoribosyltransferase